MRFTTTGKGILMGAALAVAATGCKDSSNPPVTTDMGTDSGGPTDMGTDSGNLDMGTDSGPVDMGQDAGPILPVYLRIAHLAFGSGVGSVHLCSKGPSDTTYTLVTSDALLSGNFGHPTVTAPIAYGAVTKHFALGATSLAAFAGQTIYVYREADANAAITVISPTVSFGTCNPGTATPLAQATLGVDVQLAPGTSHTVAVVGSAGAELTGMCGTSACPGPQIIDLTDDTSAPAGTPTTAKTRLVNADPRLGAAPGFCYDDADPTTAANPQAVTPGGLAAYAGAGASALTYEDASPLALIPITLPDGGPSVAPYVFTLHSGGVAGTPCAPPFVALPDGGIVQTPVMPAGIMPNYPLITQFAANAAAGAATIRAEITPSVNTTVFIAPQLIQWIETDTSSANIGMPCDVGTSATCLPMGGQCTTPSTSCYWTPIAMPVADTLL